MASRLAGLLAGGDSLAIVGMCKNAGKTTVLTRLLALADPAWTLGLTSIGRDGEAVDVVTGTSKPRIYVRAGTLLATAAGLLPHCDITRAVLADTGVVTPLGEVVVLRALSDGFVQLAGPSMVGQLAGLTDRLRALGADKVLVDGAVGRRSPVLAGRCDAVALCTGASLHPDMDRVVEETAHVCAMLTLPEAAEPVQRQAREAAPGAKCMLLGREPVALPDDRPLADSLRGHAGGCVVLVRGALTDSVVLPLIRDRLRLAELTLVAEDAGKVLLTAGTAGQLRELGVGLQALRRVPLAAVTVNPVAAGYRFSPEEFRRRMAARVAVPVLDVNGEEDEA